MLFRSQYTPNGLGRDYYITYNNAGLWENIRPIEHAPDYERVKYNNFHSLRHRTAPVKYFADGNGRDNYILQSKGMLNDEKPMSSFQLTDFLRLNNPRVSNIKQYKSRDERKYNSQLRSLEKDLIKRLYPKKKIIKTNQEEENDKNLNERINNDENLKNDGNNDSENDKINTNKANTVSAFPTITAKRINKSIDTKNKKFSSCLDNLDYLFKQSQTLENYEFRKKYKIKKNNNDHKNNIYVSQKIFNQLRSSDLNKKVKEEDKCIYYIKTDKNKDKKRKEYY